MQAKNVRPTWCLSELSSGGLMRCSFGQTLDGSKPISSACVERRNSSNIKLWGGNKQQSRCAPPLLHVLPHASPNISIKSVSVGQRSHAARAWGIPMSTECTRIQSVIYNRERERERKQQLLQGRTEGVWNGLTVLGTQYHKQFKGHRKEGGN